MFSILFVMDEFIRYLWLVIVRTMDFLRTTPVGWLRELKKKNVQISCP